ncbi:MAG: hypothetical protein CM15mP68_5500 [Pseudomonadota bacterium]|nr:MAG: hypothetical protein CM15mP68_5500 [Pseudomonadota bacterium]
MIATQVASPFLAPFKLAIYAAILLACRSCCINFGRLFHPVSIVTKNVRSAATHPAWCLLLRHGFSYFLVFPIVSPFIEISPTGIADDRH